jgi:hypothetical protein
MRGLVESYYVEGVLDPDAKGAMKSLIESRGVDLVVVCPFSPEYYLVSPQVQLYGDVSVFHS